MQQNLKNFIVNTYQPYQVDSTTFQHFIILVFISFSSTTHLALYI